MDADTIARRLAAIGPLPDDAIELAPTALMLAGLAEPSHDLSRALAHLERLARDVAAAAGGANDAESRAHVLADVLADQHGYRGDRETYDDLANADLARVIERRRGLPVALAILWIHAGRAQGWAVDGLDFPGHFIIRVGGATADDQVFVDPFEGGRIVSEDDLRRLLKRMAGEDVALAPQHTQPVGNRAVLLRLQNNIKQRLQRAGDLDGARAVVARMLMVAPNEGWLWREAGSLDAERGNLRAAREALAEAAKLAPDAPTRHRIEAEMRRIATRLN